MKELKLPKYSSQKNWHISSVSNEQIEEANKELRKIFAKEQIRQNNCLLRATQFRIS